MNKYMETVINWMILQDVINEKEKELYECAIYSSILTILPLLFAVGIGFCFGSIKRGITIVIPFMILRKYSGGYHTKKFSHCVIGSGLLLFLCIMFSMQIKFDWRLVLVTVVASVSLIVFSPVGNGNRKLDEVEYCIYKKTVSGLICLLNVLGIILFLRGFYKAITCMCIGVIMTAGLQLPCVIKAWRMIRKFNTQK